MDNSKGGKQPETEAGPSRQEKEVVHFEIKPCHGYDEFQIYFPNKKGLNLDKALQNVKCFERYIQKNPLLFNVQETVQKRSFEVDFKLLLEDPELNAEWPELQRDIVEQTEYCLNCIGLAMHQNVVKLQRKMSMLRCRLTHHEPVQLIKNLRVASYGKLVSVKGSVIKLSGKKSLVTHALFECDTCSGTQLVEQVEGNYTLPTGCQTKRCFSKSFELLHGSPYTRLIYHQTIKIQESIQDEQGQLPATVECALTNDLVGTCAPGDDVTVTGVVKAHNQSEQNQIREPSVFLLYIDAVSVVNEKNRSKDTGCDGITFSAKDYYAIQKIHAEPNLFRFLVQSFCPSICGHEAVKAGMLLALFGGSTCEQSVRADVHVLVVGDPGLGKSCMLKAAAQVAPRGVYVSANTATASGLTVTLTRESGGGYAQQAGALVMADQGCCCIDEFDKMTSQHACLLEVMEHQTISIAKAGNICTVPARASVLAAANPTGGHYDKGRTIAENLKMDTALLSRFDIVFILLDQPNEELDNLLSEHVLSVHLKHTERSTSTTTSTTSSSMASTNYKSIKNRLRLVPGETIDRLPHSLLRKYIAYARQYVKPKISEGASEILQDFYVELRKKYHGGNSTPITNRQLGALRRLTQARAKLELREEATASDAIDIIDLMRLSLVDVFTDAHGTLDFSRTQSQSCSRGGNKKLMEQFIDAIKNKVKATQRNSYDLTELMELGACLRIDSGKVKEIIELANLHGFLLKEGGNKYKVF